MARQRGGSIGCGVVSTEMASYVFLSSLITLYEQRSAPSESRVNYSGTPDECVYTLIAHSWNSSSTVSLFPYPYSLLTYPFLFLYTHALASSRIYKHIYSTVYYPLVTLSQPYRGTFITTTIAFSLGTETRMPPHPFVTAPTAAKQPLWPASKLLHHHPLRSFAHTNRNPPTPP